MSLVTRSLSDILRFAGLFEDEFVKIVVDEHYKRIQIQQKKNQTALQTALSREKELDVLFENLYEDKAFGRLMEERFLKLSYKYEDEQSAVKQNIQHLKTIVDEEKAHEMNADGFLKLVRKYTDIQSLTPEILHEFIDKIVVHHRENIRGETVQKVEIYYKMIGHVEIPLMNREQTQMYVKLFGRKEESRSA